MKTADKRARKQIVDGHEENHGPVERKKIMLIIAVNKII